MPPLTDCDAMVRATHLVTSAPSLLGGMFVACSFALAPRLRTAPLGLVLAMAACDSLFSVAWFFPVPEDRTWQCRLQGW
jgi:hypothetical protein